MVEEKEKNKTSNPRISQNLMDYIKFIMERYREEYDISITFVEASKILSKRAQEEKLFK